jgi:protein-S-isoprenylcysteine O-methyltransferase Ste14
MRQKHFIDSHKGATPMAILVMMAIHGQWENPTAWAYLATHGTYGILWVLKSRTFGDKSWEAPCGIGYGLVIWGGLSLYWLTPWLITSMDLRAPAWLMGLCLSMFSVGVFFHFASDMQKHISLQLRPGLITEGLWARCRNPNYFGELLIYAGFGLLAGRWAWVPMCVLGAFLAAVWVPNMLKKDRSLSRYPEFAAYKVKSALLIPYVL